MAASRLTLRQRNLRVKVKFGAYLGCILIYFLIFERHRFDFGSTADDSITDVEPVVHTVEQSDTSAPDGFINAWRQDRETCEQWINMQRMANSYLDAHIIGSQKGATSEIFHRLKDLRVRREGMKKEWQYFNKVTPEGFLANEITTHRTVDTVDVKQLRFNHYKAGFPYDENVTIDHLPLVDNSPIEERLLVCDGTVEHFHTDKAAFLAHMLTPHARIVATVRNPIDRAISQFNMVIRLYNRDLKAMGKPTRPASPERFHELVEKEIGKVKRCGYNHTTATLDRPTSKMLSCMFGSGRVKVENFLYVTRGLYHLHIATWRNYFPDHRILVLSMHDIAAGSRQAHNDLTDFLCIRRFPEEMMQTFEASGSTLSYGQQVANGMKNRGIDKYDEEHDHYMLDINPETRTMLNDFFRASNEKLVALLGKKMYDF